MSVYQEGGNSPAAPTEWTTGREDKISNLRYLAALSRPLPGQTHFSPETALMGPGGDAIIGRAIS